MHHGRSLTNRKNHLFAALALVVTAMFGGCQQFATYPGVEVTSGFQRADAEPVPTILACSARYARDRYMNGEMLPINLPEKTPASVYDKTIAHLTSDKNVELVPECRPMIFPEEPAIHFTEIRTRAMHAQVDMIYPTSGGFYQFVTLTLERSVLEPWRVKGERKWLVRKIEVPVPNFEPAPPEEDPKEEMAKAQR
jgi:hypothetical protein